MDREDRQVTTPREPEPEEKPETYIVCPLITKGLALAFVILSLHKIPSSFISFSR
jgi:hypothetical protein